MFYFIKSKTSDSFVNNFDGHFAYLKTLDFNGRPCLAPLQVRRQPHQGHVLWRRHRPALQPAPRRRGGGLQLQGGRGVGGGGATPPPLRHAGDGALWGGDPRQVQQVQGQCCRRRWRTSPRQVLPFRVEILSGARCLSLSPTDTHIHTIVHTYTSVNSYTHTYTDTCTRARAHTHTHTHTYRAANPSLDFSLAK